MPSWKKVIISGSDAVLNTVSASAFTGSFTGSLFGTASWSVSSSRATTSSYALTSSYATYFNAQNALTASGLIYPTADNGEFSFIQTNGAGTLSLQYVNTMNQTVYNGEATTLTKGTPVYISGSVGANPKAYRADAGNASKMPVTFIIGDNITTGNTGRAIILGDIQGVDTTGYPAGTEIYIAVGGGWTSVRPTGSAIMQVLGYVTQEGVGGKGVILNPGPANLPNISSGYIWVGNSSSVPTAIATSSIQNVISSSYATSASYTLSSSYSLTSTSASYALSASYAPDTTFPYTGSARITGSLAVTGSVSASSFTGSLLGTASYASQALSSSYATTASYVLNAVSASFATSASYALTASYVLNAVSSSFATSASYALSASSATNAVSSSFASTASYINPLNQNVIITGSLTVITGSNIEFQVLNTGVKIGNIITDIHNVTGSMNITGSVAVVNNITSSRALISSSNGTVSGSTLTVYGSGSTNPVFTVQGSQGELFSITDSLSGSLFSVNDISGLPILEVFSDSTTLIGNYQAPALYTTVKLNSISGSNVIYSLPTASYDGVFVDYTLKSGSNARAGQLMGIWSGSSANYTDNSTTDFGTTAGFNFAVIVSGSNMVVTGSSTTAGWTVKTIIRSI